MELAKSLCLELAKSLSSELAKSPVSVCMAILFGSTINGVSNERLAKRGDDLITSQLAEEIGDIGGVPLSPDNCII